MKHSGAIQVAIELYRQPTLSRTIQKSDLPTDITDVLRIAAGMETDAILATAKSGLKLEELRAACIFYLQAALFQGRPNDRRLLGLPREFDEQLLRLHKRLISKWLHPDVNHNHWESQLFNRVIAAADRLEAITQRAEVPAVPTPVKRSYLQKSQSKKILIRQKRSPFRWASLLKSLFGIMAFGFVIIVLGVAAVLIINQGASNSVTHFEAAN